MATFMPNDPLVALFSLSSMVHAQEQCSELLEQGIRDTWVASTNIRDTQFIHQELCRQHEYNRDNDTNIGVTIPIKGVPVGFNLARHLLVHMVLLFVQREQAGMKILYRNLVFPL